MAPSFVEFELATDEVRAAILRNVLESAGIPVIVQSGALQLTTFGIPAAPVQILVPRDRVEDARRALEDSRARTGEEA